MTEKLGKTIHWDSQPATTSGGMKGDPQLRQQQLHITDPTPADLAETALPSAGTHETMGNGCYRAKPQPGCP